VSQAQIKPQVYKDERSAEHFDRFHRRVREHRPNWDYELVRTILAPYLLGFFRTRAYDLGNVPADGPCILAPNHFSFLDHFFLAVYLRRKVHFMAKSQLFKLPLWPFFNYGGVFPVRRGHADQEAFDTAHAILARGDVLVMYLEGGRSRTATLSEQPKRGIGRLALESGAPVVPVAIHGSSHVRNWKRGQFPKVRVRYGDALQWPQTPDPTREQQQAVANEIFVRIKALYATLDD
jgi:1-acyl-sn-glycerol-3-phosphate acyltransferase